LRTRRPDGLVAAILLGTPQNWNIMLGESRIATRIAAGKLRRAISCKQ
jgi:hypothetical protein